MLKMVIFHSYVESPKGTHLVDGTLPPSTDPPEEAVLSAFHRLDADGSGSISPDDLRKVIGASVGINISLFIVIWWGFIVV